MESTWLVAAIWIGLALGAGFVSTEIGIVTAISETIVGIGAQWFLGDVAGVHVLTTNEGWVRLLGGTGVVSLTFLAGAELDPEVMKTKWKETSVVGVASFLVPAVGCTVVALWWIGWSLKAAAIAGIALSTTSVAVVYSVMLETGLNDTDYGKIALAACFITDIGTVLALGLVFSPFNLKTLVFVLATWWMCKVLPKATPKYMMSVWDKPSEVAAKFILMILLAMGAMALWAENEPVVPAYFMGVALAGTMGQNKVLTRELRTITRGILTPFFFIHAGALVSLPALFAAPAGFVVLFSAKIAFKFLGVYPSTRRYKTPRQEAMYTTLYDVNGANLWRHCGDVRPHS